ncbi:NAD-dependent epimerase/dehydratase family protein [Selenomonas massiliensis]|uniref:NAD-dependent epimerase/dehydratase family protein n=1 Tax=Selenomonas massiliensis TaxID=2058293 RepID=UPI0018FE2DEE|nr:NAD(P)-dependent oxidoreductase [Selenomonas massiliensis]
MWIENDIFREDMEYIANASFLPWGDLKGKTVLITGGTGLLGFNLISALSYAALYRAIPLRILALIRNEERAKGRFCELLAAGAPLSFLCGDLMHIPVIGEKVDYIIHGASPTASRYFAEHPVETIRENLTGSISLLEFARKKRIQSFLFLSSMEVYGALHRREKVEEAHESFVDTMQPRNSYPEVKRMVEALCCAYAAEYGVPAKVIRLTQTFGAGVPRNDNRVFAQLMRSALRGEDLVLKTKGGTEHSYLYTADAVTAMLSVLLCGKNGEAYNAANEDSYCSIREMAECVANLPVVLEKYGSPVGVVIREDEKSASVYPPELYMNLDTKKIRQLGWQPCRDLKDMYERMIAICDY